ncbi:hypothetical protein LEN26_014127 [Aphanomyces euteiches]|nr:hypothetical protein LEN26_015483 [Aphanomyces euteiches]KAH9108320.1 hypothetical protein LEN26_014127 [Aphanomyces euteiches]KAH9111477.1 hypothetical protein AeMF1_014013 [Aphanomyces euteiches]KAH9183736.1 hypothetical protein AeNC1_014288 [Aphanomyces euteiches]
MDAFWDEWTTFAHDDDDVDVAVAIAELNMLRYGAQNKQLGGSKSGRSANILRCCVVYAVLLDADYWGPSRITGYSDVSCCKGDIFTNPEVPLTYTSAICLSEERRIRAASR